MKAERHESAEELPMLGPVLLMPRASGDERGYFFESWYQLVFAQYVFHQVIQ